MKSIVSLAKFTG